MQISENTPLRRWQEQVVACRQARGESEEQSWQRAGSWYARWAKNNDYVALTLPRLLPLVDRGARVLEIGPGSGAFTVPLARAVQEVVAVEPSPTMRAVLADSLAQAGIANVRIVPQPIEEAVEALEGSFDLAFASYSLYNVEPVDRVIRELVRRARHVMTLMGSGERRAWWWDLCRQFRGSDPVPSPQLPHFYPLLLEMGIYADVQVFRTSCHYVYDSEEALVEWWQRYFRLDDAERSSLRAALLALAERRGPHIGIYKQSRAALVWIEQGRSLGGE